MDDPLGSAEHSASVPRPGSARGARRLVIAGLAGDAGKSLVALGLIGALRRRGLRVAPFKKGPDFIDAAWLGAAAGLPGRNLDTFMMRAERLVSSAAAAANYADVAVVEGNRGLFDGLDARGSHSTAALARLIRAPVLLVIDATKVTRTAAALVLGCRALEPDLALRGVILNRVGTARQEAVIREAIHVECGVPVLGAIPRLEGQLLPGRHLGLVTAPEHPDLQGVLLRLAEAVARYFDLDAVLALAAEAGDLPAAEPAAARPERAPIRARIGVLRDRAFSFYYPENLEALQAEGAELAFISPLADAELPAIDGLYAGGGFPEVHAAELAANGPLRLALLAAIAAGLPVWAECGGLMYLSEALHEKERCHAMVGALPIAVEQTKRPQGHGYVRAVVDGANPFLPEGTELCGHEFHYSRLRSGGGSAPTVLRLERGVGLGGGRDGLRVGSVVAAYTHLHALGAPEWAAGLVSAAAGGTS
ncbi:MAG: cobyrinate a,c-diamide synthase [Planctomycetes bacterium]|nr:cobyrinate a,c-diamide synthase [Planctomycetota bacterium]